MNPPSLIANRYQPLETIAAGHRSTVVRALDTVSGQDVAVKWRASGYQSYAQRERDALAQLKHPGIVKLVDYGTGRAGSWMVTEYLRGETLAAHVSSQTLKTGEIVELLRKVLGVLAVIHRTGYIHRDLAPENVLLRECNGAGLDPVLIDFELAQRIGSQAEDAATGSVHFMAPEQFRRQALDPRTDLYALGALAWFAASGQHPFEGGNNAQVITAVLRAQAAPLAGAPDSLNLLLGQLMNPAMAARPASADAALQIVAAQFP